PADNTLSIEERAALERARVVNQSPVCSRHNAIVEICVTPLYLYTYKPIHLYTYILTPSSPAPLGDPETIENRRRITDVEIPADRQFCHGRNCKGKPEGRGPHSVDQRDQRGVLFVAGHGGEGLQLLEGKETHCVGQG